MEMAEKANSEESLKAKGNSSQDELVARLREGDNL